MAAKTIIERNVKIYLKEVLLMSYDQLVYEKMREELVEFAKTDAMLDDFENALEIFYAEDENIDLDELELDDINDEEYGEFFDWFLYDTRLANGESVVERFMTARLKKPGTPDYVVLEALSKSFDGLFRVDAVKADGNPVGNACELTVYSAFNMKTYKVNIPSGWEERPKKDELLWGRLMPFGGAYEFAGHAAGVGFKSDDEFVEFICDTLGARPELFYADNAEGVALGRKLEALERKAFMDKFGSDIVVAPGKEIHEKYDEFQSECMPAIRNELRKLRGLPPEEAQEHAHEHGHDGHDHGCGCDDENCGSCGDVDAESSLDGIGEYESVAMIYDPEEGLCLCPDYEVFESCFSGKPSKGLKVKPEEAVEEFLYDDNVPPALFRRMLEKYPDNTKKILSKLTGDKIDGVDAKSVRKLLYQYKMPYYVNIATPSVIPVELGEILQGLE